MTCNVYTAIWIQLNNFLCVSTCLLFFCMIIPKTIANYIVQPFQILIGSTISNNYIVSIFICSCTEVINFASSIVFRVIYNFPSFHLIDMGKPVEVIRFTGFPTITITVDFIQAVESSGITGFRSILIAQCRTHRKIPVADVPFKWMSIRTII